MKPLSTWLVRIVGGVAVVAASFFATLALIDAYGGPSILDAIRQGAEVQVKFDPKGCGVLPLGELTCDAPYVGRYDPAANKWTLSGTVRGGSVLMTNSSINAPNQPGNISVWGVLATFDRAGALRVQGKDAGTIRLSQSQK
jgi:hypothetical protein